jgi:hypothetical protein
MRQVSSRELTSEVHTTEYDRIEDPSIRHSTAPVSSHQYALAGRSNHGYFMHGSLRDSTYACHDPAIDCRCRDRQPTRMMTSPIQRSTD